MATKPKNNSSKSPTKKKVTSIKKSAKKPPVRKKRKVKSTGKSKSRGKKAVIFIFLLIFSLIIAALLLSSSEKDGLLKSSEIPKKQHYSTQELLDDLSSIKVKKPKLETYEEAKKEQVEIVAVKEVKKKSKIKHDTVLKKTPFTERGNVDTLDAEDIVENISLAYRGKKPKLAILIDDVHSKAQLQAIKNLGFKMTPSIFPPYTLARKSHLLARQVKHSMIHLPMESGSKQFNKQTKTLMTSFSSEQIVDRVMEIRKLFPHVKYVNGHTGSVFTSDYKAMRKLYIALKMEGFTFVDSYTVASSKVRKIAHEFGDAYVGRDVFIDNTHTVDAIHKQLRVAVKIAKKKGYAVAIGHPHKVTMKALKSAQNILKDIELVYIDNIYKSK